MCASTSTPPPLNMYINNSQIGNARQSIEIILKIKAIVKASAVLKFFGLLDIHTSCEYLFTC